MIEQPSRRRNDDVHAASEGVFLRSVADAAEHRGAGDRRMGREILEVLEYLGCQLARGRQDERPRLSSRTVQQALQNRQQKRGGLAAARLRGGDEVMAG